MLLQRKFLLILISTLCIIPSSFIYSSDRFPKGLSFEHLGVEDGLSSSSVSKIIQDKSGILWFATQSGLNKYDGYSIEHYENDPFDRNSLSHNLIQTMYYDESGIIWIGTYGGLNRFDPETGNFTLYKHDPEDPESLSNNVVVDITRDQTGNLWVGTLDGLNKFDEEGERFIRYGEGDRESGKIPHKVIRALILDQKGTLWIGSYGGLSKYMPEADRFKTFTQEGDSNTGLRSPFVMKILPDRSNDDILWLGTWDGGVSRFNTKTEEITNYNLPHNEVYTMMFDSTGILWVGTWGHSLYMVDPSSGKVTSMSSIMKNPSNDFSKQVIYSLLEDKSGIIWIGTNGGGIYKYIPWENRFKSFIHDPEIPTTIASGKVTDIHIDADRTGWFGSYNGGLSRYDPKTEKFKHYKHDPDDPSSLSNNIVNDIFRDSQGQLWIGTNEGLNKYIPEYNSFERMYAGPDEYSLPDDVIFEITEDEKGNLWIGTYTSGVTIYKPDTGRFRVLSHDSQDPSSISDNLVRTILHDSHGDIWVGTNDGLNRYDRETGRFIRYSHDIGKPGTPSSDNIRTVYEDSKGQIWVATKGGGVNLYNRKRDSFSFLSSNDGLVSNHVLGIMEDTSGNLWFPTNRGISVYNQEKETFRTIDASNGLLSNELTKGLSRGHDGDLYFGSVGGVTIISEEADKQTEFIPPIVLTDFKVLGKEREVTKKDDTSYERIILEHTDSFFSLEFAALDYASPEQNRYIYKLEGFDKEWKKSDGRNYIGYTNLDAGNYVLSIKGAGSRGNWNERGISIPIEVEPPWWSTNLAYAGYAFLIALTVFLFFHRMRRKGVEAEYRLAEKERINQELDKKVRERTSEIEKSRTMAEKASEAKSLFLANMSHEIRTPLNGMIGMLSILSKSDLEGKQKEYLDYSRISAENLNTLVNDLLDFERIEAGELRISEERFSLREIADYIERLFRKEANEKGLSFEIHLDLRKDAELVLSDRSRIIQIVSNLVSNAIKYTDQGSVSLRIFYEQVDDQEYYHFEVNDTGAGIESKDLESIFDNFRQLDNGYAKSAQGVGLGLAIVKQVTNALGGSVSVDSELARGSRFNVVLPLAKTDRIEEKHPINPKEPNVEWRKKPRILICEDESINRLYIIQFLGGLGCSVDSAANGLEAVEKVKDEDYDLILMDLGMPKVSGIEAAEEIRAWEKKSSSRKPSPIPIIALSAHTYDEDIRKCKEAGMNDFVSKPIREEALKKTIERWLG